MTAASRGGALVETTLMMGVVLILLLGAVELGIVAFRQTAQDGAVFVAAHTYAQSPVSGVPRATSAASSVFDTIASSAIAVTPAGSLVTATTSGTESAPSLPGAPASIPMRSGATELLRNTGAAGGFTSVATLSNYRNASGTPLTTHPLIAGQPGLPSTGGCDQTGGNQGCDGNHVHVDYPGLTAEWDCRLAAYNGLTFPSQRPRGSGTGPGSPWDPASSSSPLYSIYGWDAGSSCV
jgi:Flp pilus assembly protein TadG